MKTTNTVTVIGFYVCVHFRVKICEIKQRRHFYFRIKQIKACKNIHNLKQFK